MLTPQTRSQFNTLLDALAFTGRQPDRLAIAFVETGREPKEVSQAEFLESVLNTAAGMQALGIGPKDLVIIAHTQNLESIFAFWGALALGAVPSMFPTLTEKLDADIYMEGMAKLTRLSDARAVFTADSFADILSAQITVPVISASRLADEVAQARTADLVIHRPKASSIAFLQHSSGTTGLQKGVALSHRAVLNQLAHYAKAIALADNDVVVSWLPLYHDMGLIAGFILPLVQGIPLVLMSPFDWVSHPVLLFQAILDYQGTLCWLPNFAFNHLARRIRARDLSGFSLESMRLFVNCSEPVRDDSHRLFLDRFEALGLRPETLSASYAMAENTFAITQTEPGRPPRLDLIDGDLLAGQGIARPTQDTDSAWVQVSCGRTIPGTEVAVVGDDGQLLPERHVGELAIRSDCMLTGYYRRPELEPFQDGWFMTGDKGYIADGEVFVSGRIKDLIINAGKNIFPQDIEAIVNRVDGVHPGRAVVFGVPDAREGTELIAVVAEVDDVTAEDRNRLVKSIRHAVSKGAAVSASYVDLVGPGWLIKTSSGKLARSANRNKWQRWRMA